MNVLITGGAGFIGSHTVDALLAQGHVVRVLDLLDPQIHGQDASFPRRGHAHIEYIKGDVRNVEDVTLALESVDAVYHFAALTGVGQSMYDIRNYVDVNCTGTATLLEAIVKRNRPIQRFILASSRAVYGEGTHRCEEHGSIFPHMRKREDLNEGNFDYLCPLCGKQLLARPTAEERPLNPVSVYAWTKKQQEEYCRYAADTFGLSVTILRYFNVYGSRQSLKNPYTGLISIFFSRMMAHQPIFLYEHGKPSRDFVHVSDVVEANVLALNANIKSPACINVGTGQERSITDIANALAEACGVAPDFKDTEDYRVGDIRSCFADLNRAKQLLCYQPRVTLEAGMREFCDWARHQESVDLYEKTVDELERHGLFGRGKKQVG